MPKQYIKIMVVKRSITFILRMKFFNNKKYKFNRSDNADISNEKNDEKSFDRKPKI